MLPSCRTMWSGCLPMRCTREPRARAAAWPSWCSRRPTAIRSSRSSSSRALAEEALLAFDPGTAAWTLGPAAHPRQGLHRQRRGSHGGEAEPSAPCDPEGIGTAGLSGERRRDRPRSLWCTGGPRKRCTRHSGKPSAPASSSARTAPTHSSTTASRRRLMRSSPKASVPWRIFGSADCSRRRPRRKSSKRASSTS